jgi:glycosyltransferase involved in cell wall biosynthesis
MACTILRLGRAQGAHCTVDAPALPEVSRGIREECGLVLDASSPGPAGMRWAARARARCRALAPDIVHVHLATPGLGFVGGWIARASPVVWTFHLLPGRERWPNDYVLPLRSDRVLAALARFQPRSRFVAVSAADRAQLSRRFPTQRVELATNAPPLPPEHANAVVSLAYPEGAVRLLSVSRLQPQKGLDRLITALARPELRLLEWHWKIVGDGEQRSQLEQLVRQFGLTDRVEFVGAHPAQALFAQADLVLCPSRFEGMPLVPLEAQLARVPVLLSRIAPHAEAFGEAPESFLPESEQDWPAQLARVLASRAVLSQLAQAQQQLLREDPRARLWADYARVYRELLAG